MKKIIYILFLFVISLLSYSQENPNKTKEVLYSEVPDEVPVYKGCGKFKTNIGKKKCMSERLPRFINRKFNTKVVKRIDLTNKIISLQINFNIDINGEASDIKVIAPLESLEKETIRVVKLIPKMLPGKLNGKPVVVPYSMTLRFRISN